MKEIRKCKRCGESKYHLSSAGMCTGCLSEVRFLAKRKLQDITDDETPADRITIDPNDFQPPRLRDIEVRNVSMPDLVDFFRRVNEFSPGIFEAIIKDVKRSRSQYPDGFGRD